MTSIIKFQPLSGVFDESPLAYLLQVDEFTFLLDCGWDENFNPNYIKHIKKNIHLIDAVLLSYPDLYHLGALPYIVGKCGLNVPIYATIPVYKMGQMFMYDIYQSRFNNEDFDVFTLDDVDSAFDKITQLKFSQTVGLKGKGHGLQITPIPAGHMIGGTIWKIVKDGEEEIVYAVDYNHKKERHLNGCVLEEITRPSLLITDAYNAIYEQTRRRARDEQLVAKILQTLRSDGDVLIPIDTAGRVLELAHLLDQLWRNTDSGLVAYNLALLNNVSYNVVEFAKSQVEWMSDKIVRSFEDKRNNPFNFKHLHLCHTLQELAKVPSPKVVLVSTPGLESGFSRDLFIDWCGNPKNSVILTMRTSPGTLSRSLIEKPELKTITLEVRKRVKLEGEELAEYVRKNKAKERRKMSSSESGGRWQKKHSIAPSQTTLPNGLSSPSDPKDMEVDKGIDAVIPSDDSDFKSDFASSGSESEEEMKAGDDTHPYDTFVSENVYPDELEIIDFKKHRKRLVAFPYKELRIKWDEYGEAINPEDFNLDKMNLDQPLLPTPNLEINEVDSSKIDGPDSPLSKQQAAIEGTNSINVPTKCISAPRTLAIKASIIYVDFEGRSDGESYKKIISQIKPKQLVLVHGSVEATKSLAEYCALPSCGIPADKIFCPQLNEIVNATLESRIYQVKLKDALASTFRFSIYRGTELTWLDATVIIEEDLPQESTQQVVGEEGKLVQVCIPCLDVRNEKSGIHKPRSAFFVGDPKLSDLKQVFLKAGIQAEFLGPTLVCNDLIAIKKNEAGKITFEGPICQDYFKIRELFYSQFAVF